MAGYEKQYGVRKVLFGVVEKANNRIEVRVYHANSNERQTVERHSRNARFFLERQPTYARWNIRAKWWMAAIVSDYRDHFANNRVDFTLA